MALVDNIDNVAFASSYEVDKILGTFEGSFSAPSGTVTYNSIATLITESTFFQGIYSVDAGTTWNDFNTVIDSSGTNNLDVSGRSNANTFVIRADNQTSGGGAVTYTVKYKVALIAKYNQGNVTPQPIGANIVFDTRLNYQKIFSDTSRSLTLANLSNNRETFNHALGYVPKVRSFLETTSSFASLPAGMYETGYFARKVLSAGPTIDGNSASSGVLSNSSNTYAELHNQGGAGSLTCTLFMRIYYDA